MEFSTILSAALLASIALVITPLVFVMIFKSERK